MPRINRFAVVDAATGEVIGQHLVDMGKDKVKLNGVKLDYMEFDPEAESTVVTKSVLVNLSSTKGNIDKLVSPIDPPICSKNTITQALYIYEK